MSEPERQHRGTITLAEWEPVRQRVREALQRDGLNETELAARLKLPAGTVTGYFGSDERTPPPARLALFLRWLKQSDGRAARRRAP